MNFGEVPLFEAEGAILAHSFKGEGRTIKKGTRLSGEDISFLEKSGVKSVTVALLEPSDIHEDDAAARVAEKAATRHIRAEAPFTGRSNLFAEKAGILRANRAAIDALNRVDPRITFASLPDFEPVEAGRMVATAKIIPFAVPGDLLESALSAGSGALLDLHPFVRKRVVLIATRLSHLKESTMDKTRRVLDDRLSFAGAEIIAELRVDHTESAVAGAILESGKQNPDLILLFGASAVVDEADVLPAAMLAAGGEVGRVGMPVDPGNLLILGDVSGTPVIGAPGCARSPRENGFDWILYRTLANVPVAAADIAGLGVGGLLMEIVSRPQPRERETPEPAEAVDLILLAAGRSSRMGDRNKLLARFDGVSLVRKSAETALASKARSVTVVTGHMADEIQAELAGLDVKIIHNPDFAHGMSTSLKTGLRALADDTSAALIQLADMPDISSSALNQLIDGHDPSTGRLIGVSSANGKRGNPVLLSRRFFDSALSTEGDQGAREVIAANPDAVYLVELGDAALLDVDTPEALTGAGGTFEDPLPGTEGN